MLMTMKINGCQEGGILTRSRYGVLCMRICVFLFMILGERWLDIILNIFGMVFLLEGNGRVSGKIVLGIVGRQYRGFLFGNGDGGRDIGINGIGLCRISKNIDLERKMNYAIGKNKERRLLFDETKFVKVNGCEVKIHMWCGSVPAREEMRVKCIISLKSVPEKCVLPEGRTLPLLLDKSSVLLDFIPLGMEIALYKSILKNEKIKRLLTKKVKGLIES